MRKACPVMRNFTRKNYRALIATLGAVVALSSATGLSVLAEYKFH
jgi:hypothetical protein